jgi:hypothetical protein
MPINLPNLDDRTFVSLMDEARALIPTYAPEWTDHNPTDPGITLIEFFAYLAEMLLYRLDRVTDANRLAFLKLLNGPDWKPGGQRVLADEIRETIRGLRTENRAITADDHVRHALASDPRVGRAFCLPNRDLESESPFSPPPPIARPGHVSVVIVPKPNDVAPAPLQFAADLLPKVAADLEPRRLLTTRVHVVGPRLVPIRVRITLMLRRDAPQTVALADNETLKQSVLNKAVDALHAFFDPFLGGPDRLGWPFGHDVFVSAVYQVLGQIPGVDYVTRSIDPSTSNPLDELTVRAVDAWRLRRARGDPAGELIGVSLQPHELVDAQINPDDITV